MLVSLPVSGSDFIHSHLGSGHAQNRPCGRQAQTKGVNYNSKFILRDVFINLGLLWVSQKILIHKSDPKATARLRNQKSLIIKAHFPDIIEVLIFFHEEII